MASTILSTIDVGSTKLSTTNLSQLINEFVKKELVENIKVNNTWGQFIKDDLLYGTKVKRYAQGIQKVEDFELTDKRIADRKFRNIETFELGDAIALRAYSTISEELSAQNFQNGAELAEYIASSIKAITRDMELNFEAFFNYIFEINTAFSTSLLTTQQKKIADQYKTKIVAQTITATTDIELAIDKHVRGLALVEKTHTKAGNYTNYKKNEIILAISSALLDEIRKVRKTQFNPEELFPGYKQIIILETTAKVLYLLNDASINIYPRLNKTFVEEFPYELTTDYIHHYWFTSGIDTGQLLQKVSISG